MYKVIASMFTGLALSACGAGTSITPYASSANPAVSNTKIYDDGAGVVTVSRLDENGNPSQGVLASTDVNIASEIASGSYSLVATSSSSNGNYYSVVREGAAANGSALTVTTFGENLNSSGSEYASLSIVAINNTLGILTTGTTAQMRPSGTYIYGGNAVVVDSLNETAEGSFTLSASFDSNIASLTASTLASDSSNNTAYFFSGNNILIDQSDGSFSTSNGLIGKTGVRSESASVKGYFSGLTAKGVHGIAYTNNSASPDLLGAFYGSR
jgi:hypothetical protein|tara:strand:+ start:313 stop:1122 length:810 start_codon:yes stop_codon:yes gene_type:complete